MYGYIRQGQRTVLTREVIGGVPFWVLTAGRGWQRLRVRSLLCCLARHAVHRADTAGADGAGTMAAGTVRGGGGQRRTAGSGGGMVRYGGQRIGGTCHISGGRLCGTAGGAVRGGGVGTVAGVGAAIGGAVGGRRMGGI